MANQVRDVVDGVPAFDQPLEAFVEGMQKGDALKRVTALEAHTERQRNWYRGVCLRGLSDWTGETEDEWDARLKAECGGDDLLKKEIIYLGPESFVVRRTIVGVGKNNMTKYIENILSAAITNQWPVTPPDSELRK